MRRRLLLGALALGLVAAGSATAYTSIYQPLDEGGGSGFRESRATDGFGEHEPWVVPYRDRKLVRAIFSLRNNGRWPVRVERVGRSNDPDWHGLLDFRPDENMLNPPNVYDYEGPAFTPFTLRPDEERSMSVALWLDHCEFHSAGGSMTFSEVPVRYRAFGMAHTAWIELEKPFEIVYEKASQCPRPAVR
ncbi:MAG TPA: hypothetical protein VNQ77_04240 [Frankiaceae bacterium]|nr:hypothetical protein [Frankiaceae bacterium]